jgi:large subunit ribosomal protein L6
MLAVKFYVTFINKGGKSMSRIGKLPIAIPAGVTINVSNENIVSIKGPKGTLTQKVDKDIEIAVEGNQILVKRPTDQKRHRAMHGLYRALLNNMVNGVSNGYEIKLELVGVGYRADAQNQILDLVLGYSHHTYLQMPAEVNVEAVTDKRSNPIITLKSIDKQLIGHVAAKIRSFRMPEPYKGKGVKFVGEKLRRKAGKSASKK